MSMLMLMLMLMLMAMLLLMLIIVYRSWSAALLGFPKPSRSMRVRIVIIRFQMIIIIVIISFLESRCNMKLTKSITLCFCFRLLVFLSTKLTLIIWSTHSFPLWKWLLQCGPATSIINDGGYLQLWSQIKAIMNAINVMITSYKLSILMHRCNDIATSLIEQCCFCPTLTTRIISRVL